MSKENKEKKEEKTEPTDYDKLLIVAQDLLDMSILVQKVLNRSTIHLDAHNDAKLLVGMSNAAISQFSKQKEDIDEKEVD